ncbi:MAG TPA: hypothetical protein PLJ21_00810 [Pseudobdellovibrionaceae bacterium]|nr:hypothetical protein [Pseudobdellovibrionaceae bacterium]
MKQIFKLIFNSNLTFWLILLSLSLLPLKAVLAHPFNGKWVGSGVAYDTQKMKIKCSSMSYTIDSQNEFINVKSQFECGNKNSFSLEGQLVLKGEDLYYKNQQVGTLKGNRFDLRIKDHHHSIQVSGVTSSEKTMNLIEIHTYQPIPDYFYTVEGSFNLESSNLELPKVNLIPTH